MNRITSFLPGLSLAVLFFVTSADAQSERRMSADVPFDFTVGGVSLPAGHYEFLGAGDTLVQILGADGRNVFTLPSASIQPNGIPEKSALKFAYVDGHHVLFQIWNERAAIGSEFPSRNNYVESVNPTVIDGTVTGR
jgi:hypothetical protein